MSLSPKTQKNHWEISNTRYKVFPVTEPADLQACLQVLEEVRKNELNRVAGKPDTRILLFSAAAYLRLGIEADRTCFWRNLSRVLAQRVLASDKLLI